MTRATGTVAQTDLERDGVDGVDGLNGVTLFTISPDQKHLYAPGEFDDALAVFGRDAAHRRARLPAGTLQLAAGDRRAQRRRGCRRLARRREHLRRQQRQPARRLRARARHHAAGHRDHLRAAATHPELDPELRLRQRRAVPRRVPVPTRLRPLRHLHRAPAGTRPHRLPTAPTRSRCAPSTPLRTRTRLRPPRGFVVDTVAPDTAITGGPTGRTGDETPTFAFTGSDSNLSGFECQLDGGPFEPCSGPGEHTAAALGDGVHAFSVRAEDAAGNVDPSPATRSFDLDATAPDTQITRRPKNRVFTPQGEDQGAVHLDRRRAGGQLPVCARQASRSRRAAARRSNSR